MTPRHSDETGVSGVSPWLASLMLRRGGTVLPRFAVFYGRLSGMSRPWRRRLRRKLAVTVTGAALLLAMGGGNAWAQPAAPETVITVVNGEVAQRANGKCSFVEAIKNANNQTTGRPFADCAAGNPTGADTIVLPQSGLFMLTAAENTGNYGPNGLPWIGSTITIEGNGSTIQRKNDAPPFRIMAVGPNGNLTLKFVTITGGGGEFLDSENGHFDGGGLFNQGNTVVQSSTIFENKVYAVYSARGGGLSNFGTMNISESFIIGNEAAGYYEAHGGGINNYASLTISNSTISGNNASNQSITQFAYVFGGGIANRVELTVTNSVISDNHASSPNLAIGGGIFSDGDATISRSIFSGNDSDGYGGGINNGWIGSLSVINSTISNNASFRAGGGIRNASKAEIINTTITGNENGGVFADCMSQYYGSTYLVVKNSIVSGNGGAEIQFYNGEYCSATIKTLSNVFGHSGNAGLVGFDPNTSDIVPSVALSAILSPLANNGGPTQTHALPPGSPALDRVPNNACTAVLVGGVDQRGFPRNQNGAGGTSANECDIGAFEAGGSGGGAAMGFYVSAGGSGTVGGVAFAPADILKYDPNTGWSMYFDGSDVGITKNVSAIEMQSDGRILLSLAAAQPVAGLGTVAPQDVIQFNPTATGPNTAGSFQMKLDGSARWLTTSGEKIDALAQHPDGRLAVSTTGAAAVQKPDGSPLKAQDEDALGFNFDLLRWSALFDGTPVAGLAAEDVNGLWIDPVTGDLYITLVGAFNLGGVAGNGSDIVKLAPNGGAPGGYTASLVFDGSAAGFPSTIDGLEMIP